MKKTLSILTVLIALVSMFAFTACGGSGDTSSESSGEKIYGVGDTWTVDGQWSLTVNSVEVTDERNEYEEGDPAQVIIIDYTYENIGYEDPNGIMNGLFLDFGSAQIVDQSGQMCRQYMLMSVTDLPQEAPVGATCHANTSVGLTTADGDSVTIYMTQYDSSGEPQKAQFELEY